MKKCIKTKRNIIKQINKGIFNNISFLLSIMIRKDIKEFLNTLPKDITLVAATKYGDVDDLKKLYSNGVFNFGENRVDAFLNKYEALKDLNIKWHFIGHLQRNKAHLVLDKIDYLHSLDSLELVKTINKYRLSPLNCFVEVSINLEENKNGVPYYEVKEFIKECLKYPNVNIVGLMMMAVASSSEESLHNQFRQLKELKDNLEKELNISLPYLSMGMSDDYKVAIEEGATHIRLGRVLFNRQEQEIMALKDEWKSTGKNTGKAFANFGKALGKTMKSIFSDDENMIESNGHTEVSNAWRDTGKAFGSAGKSFGKAVGDTFTGCDEEPKEKPEDKAEEKPKEQPKEENTESDVPLIEQKEEN